MPAEKNAKRPGRFSQQRPQEQAARDGFLGQWR